eukprot:TRINITY_DN4872_c2_g1_i1.p1 TRINITY_DN4872_c2_g1~~TRINITY_DN4872_c2_g1_i1.p1  ORF type:complete len:583 (+),score=134.50 TRINITY_DN4872_c2_g1_i1:90-1751(+)
MSRAAITASSDDGFFRSTHPFGSPSCTLVVSRGREDMGERIAVCLTSRIIQNPALNIGVTVGATPTSTYQHLSELARRGIANLSDAHFLLFDEFFPDPASSYTEYEAKARAGGGEVRPPSPHFQQLEEVLFSPANIPLSRVHRPLGEMAADQAVSQFKEVVGVRAPDVLVVGVGTNGVVGWNENDTSTACGVHKVDISESTPVCNHGYRACVTLGPKNILEAKEVFLLAAARNKAELINKMLYDKDTHSVCSWILRNHPRVTLFIDAQAAACLPRHQAETEFKGFTVITSPDYVAEKRIICFSPHPDDTSISAGAALALLAQNNSTISCCCTTGHRAHIPNTTPTERVEIREKEASSEAALLGALAHFLRLPLYGRGFWNQEDVDLMKAYFEEQRPSLIFVPHTADSHPTHRAVLRTILQTLLVLCSHSSSIIPIDVFMYEGPWSLFPRGAYNSIVSPPPDCFAKKLAAIRAHVSQTGRTPYDEAADALGLLRGALVPEQDLGGFGADPPRLQRKLELFFHRRVERKEDVELLIHWFDNEQAPNPALIRNSTQ